MAQLPQWQQPAAATSAGTVAPEPRPESRGRQQMALAEGGRWRRRRPGARCPEVGGSGQSKQLLPRWNGGQQGASVTPVDAARRPGGGKASGSEVSIDCPLHSPPAHTSCTAAFACPARDTCHPPVLQENRPHLEEFIG